MKQVYKKQLTDSFSNAILNKFDQYCIEQNINPNLENFLTYLVDRGLIPSGTIQNYTVVEAFVHMSNLNGTNKTKLVESLANRFNITSRTVWNILRKYHKN